MENKPWYKSRTIWGLAITAISIFAPKYQPIAEALPSLAFDLGKIGGLLLGFYGRLKAAPGVTLIDMQK